MNKTETAIKQIIEHIRANPNLWRDANETFEFGKIKLTTDALSVDVSTANANKRHRTFCLEGEIKQDVKALFKWYEEYMDNKAFDLIKKNFEPEKSQPKKRVRRRK